VLYEIIYVSPHYEEEVHNKILKLLGEIRKYHGIPWRELRLKLGSYADREGFLSERMKEREIYEQLLKPFSRLIKANSEFLANRGVNAYIETAAEKFKSRSGHIYVLGSIIVRYNDITLWAGHYKDEVLSFLTRLLDEGRSLLDVLEKRSVSSQATRREKGIDERRLKLLLAKYFEIQGYEVYVDVKHNMLAGEEPTYLFSPDADLILIKDNEVVGIEVKGESSIQHTYVGLGEALLYLVNPLLMVYKGSPLRGGIFDKVYLALPSIPQELKEDLIGVVAETPIGLIVIEEAQPLTLVKAKYNSLLNEKKKNTLLENRYVLYRYRHGYSQNPF